MTTHYARCLLSATALAALVVPVQAQDAYPADPKPTRQYVIDLGGGAMVQPRYEGADSYLIYPFPIISVANFYFPGLGQVADDGINAVSSFIRRSIISANAKPATVST